MHRSKHRFPDAKQLSFVPQPSRPGRQRPSNEVPREAASALRVKNFRALRDTLGEEHLGALLGLTLERTKELSEGFNFSNELAHHIEFTLGLPSGFIDQANPRLTDEEIARLKAPVVEDTANAEEPSAQAQTVQPAAPTFQLRLVEPTSMKEDQPEKEHSMVAATHSQESQQAATNEDELRAVRRNNFALLLSRPGSKAQMAKLAGLKPANISHRLHGNKIFDADEGNWFCKLLNLPAGWFDSPHQENEVPEHTWAILTDGTGAGPAPARPQRAASKKAAAPEGQAPKRRGRPPKKPGIPSGLASITNPSAAGPAAAAPAPVSRSAPSPARSPAVAKATPGQAPAAARASGPASAGVTPAAARQFAAGSAAEAAIQSVGGGVGKAAEVLLRTIAAKSRSGALTEEKALALLGEVAML